MNPLDVRRYNTISALSTKDVVVFRPKNGVLLGITHAFIRVREHEGVNSTLPLVVVDDGTDGHNISASVEIPAEAGKVVSLTIDGPNAIDFDYPLRLKITKSEGSTRFLFDFIFIAMELGSVFEQPIVSVEYEVDGGDELAIEADWQFQIDSGTDGEAITETQADGYITTSFAGQGIAETLYSGATRHFLVNSVAQTPSSAVAPVIVNGQVKSGGTKSLRIDLDLKSTVGRDNYQTWREDLPAGITELAQRWVIQFDDLASSELDPPEFADSGNDIAQALANGFGIAQRFLTFNRSSIKAHGQIDGGGSTGSALLLLPRGEQLILKVLTSTALQAQIVILQQIDGTFLGAVQAETVAGEIAAWQASSYLTTFGGHNDIFQISLAANDKADALLNTFTVPPVTLIDLIQIDTDQLAAHYTQLGCAVTIEVNHNSGGFVEVENNYPGTITEPYFAEQTVSYPFAVIDGDTYQLRLTSRVGNNIGSAVTTSVVTVNNSAFLATERTFIGTLVHYQSGGVDQYIEVAGSWDALHFTTGALGAIITELGFLPHPDDYGTSMSVTVRKYSDDSVVATRTLGTGTPNTWVWTNIADITLAANTRYYLNYDGPLGYRRLWRMIGTDVNPAGGMIFHGNTNGADQVTAMNFKYKLA